MMLRSDFEGKTSSLIISVASLRRSWSNMSRRGLFQRSAAEDASITSRSSKCIVSSYRHDRGDYGLRQSKRRRTEIGKGARNLDGLQVSANARKSDDCTSLRLFPDRLGERPKKLHARVQAMLIPFSRAPTRVNVRSGRTPRISLALFISSNLSNTDHSIRVADAHTDSVVVRPGGIFRSLKVRHRSRRIIQGRHGSLHSRPVSCSLP
jgi:hypothetical protein